MAISESIVDSGNGNCSGRPGAIVVFARFTEGRSKASFSSPEPGAGLGGASGSGGMVIPGEALGGVETIVE